MRRNGAPAGVLTGYGLGLVALPIAALPSMPAPRDVVTVGVAVGVAVCLAALYSRLAATSRNAWFGGVLVAVAALLYAVTPAGVSTAIIALFVGAGVGLMSGPVPLAGRRAGRVAGVATCATVLAAAWAVGGSESSLPFLVAGASALLLAAAQQWWPGVERASVRSGGADPIAGPDSSGPGHSDPDRVVDPAEADTTDTTDTTAACALDGDAEPGRVATPPRRGLRRALVWVAALGAVTMVAWTGCNDPQLSWFGPVAWHGPRDRPQVAITFDDGPNSTASLKVARILDEHGAKGTFFLVGKAVVRRPDVARQLVADGHLVGNHSYHHDYQGWLNPLYPELGATQAVIGREVGVCPRFFRPPHGQRTPLMNAQVARRGMVTVTWDVSAADWVTNDPQLVARRILGRVRPGSIILLHDSIDGHVDADRQVVIDALPIILDGLARKGLQPVRIDELLGGPAYLPDADC